MLSTTKFDNAVPVVNMGAKGVTRGKTQQELLHEEKEGFGRATRSCQRKTKGVQEELERKNKRKRAELSDSFNFYYITFVVV